MWPLSSCRHPTYLPTCLICFTFSFQSLSFTLFGGNIQVEKHNKQAITMHEHFRNSLLAGTKNMFWLSQRSSLFASWESKQWVQWVIFLLLLKFFHYPSISCSSLLTQLRVALLSPSTMNPSSQKRKLISSRHTCFLCFCGVFCFNPVESTSNKHKLSKKRRTSPGTQFFFMMANAKAIQGK